MATHQAHQNTENFHDQTPEAGGHKNRQRKKAKAEKAGRGTQVQKEEDLTLAVIQNFFTNLSSAIENRQRIAYPDKAPRMPKVEHDKLNWLDLKHTTGIDITKVDRAQVVDLLYGKKTGLLPVHKTVDEKQVNASAKLSLGWNAEKQTFDRFLLDYPRKKLNLDKSYHNYSFTEEDKKNLLQTGNLGKAVDIVFYENAVPQKRFISIDRELNKPVSVSAEHLKLGKTFMGVDLEQNPQIKEHLENGRRIYVTDLLIGERKVESYVQYNAAKKQFDFDMPEKFRQQVSLDRITSEMTRFNEGREGYFYRGKEFSQDQMVRLSFGESLLAEDLKTKEGRVYSAYVFFDEKSGRLSAKSPSKSESHTTSEHSAQRDVKPKVKEITVDDMWQPKSKKRGVGR